MVVDEIRCPPGRLSITGQPLTTIDSLPTSFPHAVRRYSAALCVVSSWFGCGRSGQAQRRQAKAEVQIPHSYAATWRRVVCDFDQCSPSVVESGSLSGPGTGQFFKGPLERGVGSKLFGQSAAGVHGGGVVAAAKVPPERLIAGAG